MASDTLSARSNALLARWARAVEGYWHEGAGAEPLGCYGPGYIHWGVQSNWNYAAAMATLAAQPGVGGRDHWRARATAALRFALATHVTGERTGNDGRQWGHSWISMLGIERGMHALPLLEDHLADRDRAALRRVLVSEADWLLHDAHRGDHHGVFGGVWNDSGKNVPESNIWWGALLWRAAQRYPDALNAEAWKARAHAYFINGISVPQDAQDTTVIAGKPVAEWFAGANFFSNYALDHHGYLNVGYMAICVSNAAMLHFDMKRAGLPVPESLVHHQADLWEVLRRMIFGNGRLARIGGDSRVRYSYCQEYLLPSLLFATDALDDAYALSLAEQQLGLIEQETAASDDGTFYGRRMGHLRDANPHYFTRLESDRACVLSMLITYLPLLTTPPEPVASLEASVAGGWSEPEHGAVLHRSPTRLASFSWRARGLAQALCVPPGDPTAISTAEWSRNLTPVVRFLGDRDAEGAQHRRLLRYSLESFPGGFATCGAVMEGVDVRIDEGARCTNQAVTHVAFAALPDGRTCVGMQLVVAARDRIGYLIELKGLHLNVANDLFNGFRRTLYSEDATLTLTSPPDAALTRPVVGAWLNVDDVLGVVLLSSDGPLWLDRAPERRGGRYRSLFVEEVCSVVERGPRPTEPGEILIDAGFVVLSGASAEATAACEGGVLQIDDPWVRGVWVVGADGRRHSVLANFGDVAARVTVGRRPVVVPPGAARVSADGALLGDGHDSERTGD